MAKSPCIECPMNAKDKNNMICQECEKRIKYAREQGMIPQGTEMDGLREEKIKESNPQPDSPKKKHRGRQPRSKNKPKHNINPSDLQEQTKTNPQLNIEAMQEKFEDTQKIMAELEVVAKAELRSTLAQALYFIREGIAAWRVEHPNNYLLDKI